MNLLANAAHRSLKKRPKSFIANRCTFAEIPFHVFQVHSDFLCLYVLDYSGHLEYY